ncbi:MAG: hypothetical protein IJU12_04195 [Clostridia bacterium]|nr:hypothetical protein [Clostridia bacterium]
MKRIMDDVNLRNAFRPMPDACYDALMDAARSVREEEKMKRTAFRTVLIVALILILTTAAALASGKIFGWTDFFGSSYGTQVPKAAQEIMQHTEKQESKTLGGIIFTPHELYADKNIVMAAVEARLPEGEKGLVCGDDPFGIIGANQDNGKAVAEKLGIDPMITWVEAAKQLNVPLYSAEALLEVPLAYYGSEMMSDPMFNEDGSLTYFSVQPLNGKASGERFDCQLYLRVARINLENVDGSSSESDYMDISIPLAVPTETVTYDLKEDYLSYGMKLESVYGELTPAGLYLYADFTAQDDMTVEQYYEKGQVMPMWFDENGQPYPFGMNESYIMDTEEWPILHTMGLISVDSIPDTLVMALEDDNLGSGEPAPRITLIK